MYLDKCYGLFRQLLAERRALVLRWGMRLQCLQRNSTRGKENKIDTSLMYIIHCTGPEEILGIGRGNYNHENEMLRMELGSSEHDNRLPHLNFVFIGAEQTKIERNIMRRKHAKVGEGEV